MVRLTEKEASGKWRVRGLPWESLREGAILTKETSGRLYGCLCKLKDYEDTGMNPDRLQSLWYQLEEMARHVCDELCRYQKEAGSQEELEEICAGCPVSACMGRMLELTK